MNQGGMTGVIVQVYASEQAMHAPHAYICSKMVACTCIHRCTCLQRHRPAADVASCTDVRAHTGAPCSRPDLTAAGRAFTHLRFWPAHMACEGRSTVLTWPISSSGAHLRQSSQILANGFWVLGKGSIYFLRITISPDGRVPRGRIRGPLVTVSLPCAAAKLVGFIYEPVSLSPGVNLAPGIMRWVFRDHQSLPHSWEWLWRARPLKKLVMEWRRASDLNTPIYFPRSWNAQPISLLTPSRDSSSSTDIFAGWARLCLRWLRSWWISSAGLP